MLLKNILHQNLHFTFDLNIFAPTDIHMQNSFLLLIFYLTVIVSENGMHMVTNSFAVSQIISQNTNFKATRNNEKIFA